MRYRPDCVPRPPIVTYIAPSVLITTSVPSHALPSTNGSNVPRYPAPSGARCSAYSLPYVQSMQNSAFWYLAGNFAPYPNTTPVGEPMPMLATAGRLSG